MAPHSAPRAFISAVLGSLLSIGLVALGPALGGFAHGGLSSLAPGPVPATSAGGAIAPAAMTLSVDGDSPAAISLSWTSPGDLLFSNYTIYSSTVGPTGPWNVSGVITSQTTTTVAITDLAPGGDYWWNVTAYSPTSPTQSTNVVEQVQAPLAVLGSSGNTTTSIALNWTNSASYGGLISFVSYAVEESASGGAPTTVTTITNVATLTYDVTGLSAGTSYSFYVNTTDCVQACSSGSPGLSVTQSNTLPTGTLASLTSTLTAGLATVDTGQRDFFTCTPSGGQSPYSFSWNFSNGSGFVSGKSSESHSFSTAGSVLVTCRVTDNRGSRSTVSVTVRVDRAPTVTTQVAPTNITAGGSVGFNCTAKRGTPPFSVTWDFGDGSRLANLSGVEANFTHTYGTSGAYVAQCSAIDSLGIRAVAAVVVHVAAVSPFAWVTPTVVLGFAALAGLLIGLTFLGLRRRAGAADEPEALSRWVPPGGPRTTVRGSKVCPSCGASNLPIRRTCQACGAPLTKWPGR